MTSAKNDCKPTPLMTPLTKKPKSKTFQFFVLIQTRRLAASFEGLNNSLAQPACELWRCKVTKEKWLMQVLKANPLSSEGVKFYVSIG